MVALTGCSRLSSEVGALTVVGGDREAAVSTAGYDVLLQKRVDVMVWPDCVTTGKAITCTGSTASGQKVVIDSPATEPVTMTVTVGGEQVFSGEVQPVLDAAAGQTP